MATTSSTKPRGRSRTPVPDVAPATSSSAALDELTHGMTHPDQEGFVRTTLVAVANLTAHPANPRRDVGDVTELADSIRAHGVRQNLLVVPDPDNPGDLRIVIGHRRTAAARLAGVTHLPAVVDPSLTSADQLQIMLLENVQRQDLTPVEEADAYQGLLDLGTDVATIATRIGRSESTVRSRLRLVTLPEEARTAIHARSVTLEDAAALADLPEHLQAPVLKTVGTSNFQHEMARARDLLRREEQVTPLLDVLAAANAPELPSNVWAEPGAIVAARGRPAQAAELAASIAGQVGPGWSWRWYYGEVLVYRPQTLEEAQEAAKAAEKRAAWDAEREEHAEKARADRAVREEFASITAETRREFLEHLIHGRKALTKDQVAHLLDYTATALAEGPWDGTYVGGTYRHHPVPYDTEDADGLATWLRVGLPADQKLTYHRHELLPLVTAAAAGLSAPQRLLVALAAALEPISEDTWRWGGRSVTTARWYELLERLGYTVSDAEHAALVVEDGPDDPENDGDVDDENAAQVA
ncbi:ParB/RepB/Spo0J family partition protein [Cellulomonas gilvus]|uniref:ParB-like partition protein n=1 Tax=Cellulomonas gilvus (strain ATCC 13127 / NRRL B-14078) TaxID=593907 RepID=F8A2Z3_CELGA|nr:ParB/RepB/Spo0J family partition protein [Cellulomonas gilvus]AEI11848.1 parB-like partition protein [Cellulomonas gilvus ATCC 13127]